MSNESNGKKVGLLRRIRRAFRYDTDPKNSSSIMQNHIVVIFDGFYLTLLIILAGLGGIAYLILSHYIGRK